MIMASLQLLVAFILLPHEGHNNVQSFKIGALGFAAIELFQVVMGTMLMVMVPRVLWWWSLHAVPGGVSPLDFGGGSIAAAGSSSAR